MADENRWKKVILIGLGILALIIILITLFVGLKSLKVFFVWLLGFVIVLGILFGLGYLFYIIFIQIRYKDLPASYKKKLIKTAKLMKNKMLGDLYLSGDHKHNRIKLGRYAYMRINLPRQIFKSTEKDKEPEKELTEREKKKKEVTESVPVDCFVILKRNILDILFGNPIFILVKPEDHNYSSIFNDVVLSAFNLIPLDKQFYTIDKRNLDIDISKGITTSYFREMVWEVFTDLDKVVKMSMNLDQQFQKDKVRSSEFEIPQLPQIGQK